MAEDRTEKPTSRRLRDARRKGQIARSRDVEQAAQLVAVIGVFAWGGRSYVEGVCNVNSGGRMKELLEYRQKMIKRLGESTQEFCDACRAVSDPLAKIEGEWNVHQIASHTRMWTKWYMARASNGR